MNWPLSILLSVIVTCGTSIYFYERTRSEATKALTKKMEEVEAERLRLERVKSAQPT